MHDTYYKPCYHTLDVCDVTFKADIITFTRNIRTKPTCKQIHHKRSEAIISPIYVAQADLVIFIHFKLPCRFAEDNDIL